MPQGINRRALLKALRTSDLIVKPKLDVWLIEHADDPVPPHISARVAQLLSTTPRVRSASFSASSAGKCPRAQTYGFLGVPSGSTTSSQLANIFHDGKWRHLRTQVQMLMAGLIVDIVDIEVPLPWASMRSMATMDGVGVVPIDHPRLKWRGKEFGIEIKGANSFVFDRWKAEGPDAYADQYDRYFLAGGFELFVVYMENKNTQETMEWVVERNQARLDASLQELQYLNDHVDKQKLPPRLPDCQKRIGETFRKCGYGGLHGPCDRLSTWKDSLNP